VDLQQSSVNVDWHKLVFGAPKVTKEGLLDFTNELAILTESGLTLLAALKQLEKQSGDRGLRSIVPKIATEIQGGTPFHEALKMHPQAFSESYCSIVEANERAGTLEAGLKQIGKQLKQQIATKAQVQRAITQPLIIIGLAIVVVILMVVVVLPPLLDIFKQFGADLPITTRILIAVVEFVSANKWWLLIGLLFLVGLGIIVFRQPDFKPVLHRWMFKIPLFGPVINWNNTAYFSRTLSNLLGAGILLPDGINILLRGITNIHYREALVQVRKELIQGQSLSSVMSKNEIFPSLLVEMIGVGEASGNLEYALGTVADYFEARVEKRINRLTALIEPVLIIAVGLVVAFMAISMISTIYGLVGNFQG
jgi:type IV pilus assembly protein PilC